MKRLFTIIATILLSSTLLAQVSLDEVTGRLDSNRIQAGFSCTFISQGTPMICKGTVLAQGRCFHSDINGIESYCDGQKIVLLDRKSKEAYIEDASGLKEYLESNVGNISGLEFSELRFLDISDDMSAFCVDLSSFGKDWVITDLRQE